MWFEDGLYQPTMRHGWPNSSGRKAEIEASTAVLRPNSAT
jgi:hypothetical protein